jgi:glycosyltransferase involved in cell wall biosynthesis
MKPNLYVFQWISDLGGADTRLKELLVLLKDDFNITCMPNDEFRLGERHNTDFLDSLGVKYCMPSGLPSKLDGYAYANCNFRLFKERERLNFINDSGLKLIWSNDMMWTTSEELECISSGKIDMVLFTSPFHRSVIGPAVFKSNPSQKGAVLENYFDSSMWPYVERPKRDFVVCGKVSRDDHMKFSEDFPVFYESAAKDLPVKYSVMGWSDSLTKKYSWFNFSDRWNLMNTNKMKTHDYLSSIDIFLYNCNFKFVENQSRAVVEAQLSGAPVVAPNKWNFPNMVWAGRTGVLWDDLYELRESMKELMDYDFRKKMSKMASDCTRQIWCDAVSARRKWESVINYLDGGSN